MGSFNGWVPEILGLNEGIYSKTLLLPEGSHQYLFQIDGQNTLDPSNPDSVSNGMGSFNSLVSIGQNPQDFHIQSERHDQQAIYSRRRDYGGTCNGLKHYADSSEKPPADIVTRPRTVRTADYEPSRLSLPSRNNR